MRRPGYVLRRLTQAVLKPPSLSRDRALGISERLGALTTLNSSLEYLTQRKQTEPGGLSDWSIVRDLQLQTSPMLRKVLDGVSGSRTTTAIHVSRSLAAAALLTPGNQKWRGAVSLYLAASGLFIYPRHIYGTDGSDQVSLIVQGATGAARLVPSDSAKDALIWYIAAQANLSYAISGWVKLFGKQWRDATALPGVMRTRTYGHSGMWAWTQKHPKASRLLTHSVLALECGFPFIYAFGGRFVRPVIGSVVLFHGANAYLMGLGRFFTAFTSMHPLVAYTAIPKSDPVGARRDDRLLPLAAAALSLSAAGSVVSAIQRRMRVRQGPSGGTLFTARSGNVLQYESHTEGDSSQPVLVFETGMVATPEYFSWIINHLEDNTRLGLLSYARAGYNGSLRKAEGPYNLGESVADLADLVQSAVAPGRRVILVGHSLGGDIARRAAPLLADRLDGVVYLDSSHPAELLRSTWQAKAAGRLSENFKQMEWFLRMGTGSLLTRPTWLDDLPESVRSRVFAQYADGLLWRAGRREWAAVQAEFSDACGNLPSVPGRGLVVSAQQTVDRDPEQLLMHGELAKAHQEGAHTAVIEGADHSGLLTKPGHAIEVARLIATFAADSIGVATSALGSPAADHQRHKEGTAR
ncbi:alpha/beta fold hydrolase [Streptomyces sp. NPDC052236]|uniref:alpha/beta fold hydrolase n=1 Tax=Streptomyces sp. NPDC052236 TaxID=3365686 RepID=UPI0037D4E6D6